MQMADVPMQLPATKNVRCITQAQVDDPASTLPSGSPDPKADCKVSDYKAVGSKVTWNLACSGSEPMTGQGEIVVDGDQYDGTMKMTMSQGAMTMKYSGKRVGDCHAVAGRARGCAFHAGAALVAVVLALAETWPLATRIATAYPIQRRPDDGRGPGQRERRSTVDLLDPGLERAAPRRPIRSASSTPTTCIRSGTRSRSRRIFSA